MKSENMDDKQAILAEIHDCLREDEPKGEREIAELFATSPGEDAPDQELLFLALGYLAAKRRYDKAPEPVKTGMSFEEWNRSSNRVNVASGTGLTDMLRETWNAALANAQTGGIEVGQPCQVFDHQKQQWVDGVYGATDSPGSSEDVTFWSDPADVRPAPKTVELTDDEKLAALMNSPKAPVERRLLQLIVIEGKTLDQLCATYGVETKRSV